NTSSRGASSMVVEMISCLPGSMTYSVLGIVISLLVAIGLLLLNQILQDIVEALEAFVPEPSVLPHPLGRLLQAPGLEAARPPLRVAALRDQAGVLQHFQVFADSGKAEVERLGQFRDRGLSLRKTSQDRPPRGIGEGCERDAELITCHLYLST